VGSRYRSKAVDASASSIAVGTVGEDKALAFFLGKGFELLTRNFRCKAGEIDLILLNPENAEIVFVEVRFRSRRDFGGAAASVGFTKQRRLRIAAELFLLKHYGARRWPACRFDVLAIEADRTDWIPGAF
jgi:putative endonuclease